MAAQKPPGGTQGPPREGGEGGRDDLATPSAAEAEVPVGARTSRLMARGKETQPDPNPAWSNYRALTMVENRNKGVAQLDLGRAKTSGQMGRGEGERMEATGVAARGVVPGVLGHEGARGPGGAGSARGANNGYCFSKDGCGDQRRPA